MSKTNCINCGAAKEVSDIQCPFCGTRYADFTVLDPMSDEPIYIQLNKGGGKIITAKAYISQTRMCIEPMITSIRDSRGMLSVKSQGSIVHGTIDYTLYESI